MQSLQERIEQNRENIEKEARKNDRFKCIDEFFNILNHERATKNESVVYRFRQEFNISKEEAIKKAKSMKYMYLPPVTKKLIAIRTSHLDAGQLRDFLDMVKGSSNFNRCFFGSLKIK
jgi:hypothetical protein